MYDTNKLSACEFIHSENKQVRKAWYRLLILYKNSINSFICLMKYHTTILNYNNKKVVHMSIIVYKYQLD